MKHLSEMTDAFFLLEEILKAYQSGLKTKDNLL